MLTKRIVKSAMSEALADARGDAGDGQIQIRARWGRGGAGMLITGNAMMDGYRHYLQRRRATPARGGHDRITAAIPTLIRRCFSVN